MIYDSDLSSGVLILGAATSFIGAAIETLEECNIPIKGLVTNLTDLPVANKIQGYHVFQLRELSPELKTLPAICVIGTPEYRRSVVSEAGDCGVTNFYTVAHPKAFLARSAQIGRGCFFDANATIASGVTIGDHVMINQGALVGHDNYLESFITLAPGVKTGGLVRIKEGAYLGIGATILPEVTIGKNSVIAAGAVVTTAVPDNVLVAGVPAVIKRMDIAGYRGKWTRI